MLPLDWDWVNRWTKTNRKRKLGSSWLQRTIVRFSQTKGAVEGTAFLWNDSDSSCPRRQRRAVTSHTASLKLTNKQKTKPEPLTFSNCHSNLMCCKRERMLCKSKVFLSDLINYIHIYTKRIIFTHSWSTTSGSPTCRFPSIYCWNL